jgi:hypothetical protein
VNVVLGRSNKNFPNHYKHSGFHSGDFSGCDFLGLYGCKVSLIVLEHAVSVFRVEMCRVIW